MYIIKGRYQNDTGITFPAITESGYAKLAILEVKSPMNGERPGPIKGEKNKTISEGIAAKNIFNIFIINRLKFS
jgi:hypothetical protein